MRTALDTGNRHAHLLFYLEDGNVYSSRDIHFHDINLYNIVKIQAKFKYFTHTLKKVDLPESFKEFVHYRSGGVTFVNNGQEILDKRPINTWSLGWTDGNTEFIQEYQFKTGELLREHKVPRDQAARPSHFHPESGGTGS